MILDIFLKLFGLKFLFNPDSSNIKNTSNKIIQIDQITGDIIEGDQEDDDKLDNFYLIKILVNILYFLVILITVCWPLIFSMIYAIINHDFQWFSSNIYTSNYIIQFLVGFLYYRSDHYVNIIQDRPRLLRYSSYLTIIILVISLSIALVSMILTIKTSSMNIYSIIYDYTSSSTAYRVLFLIYLFFTLFISYNIILLNFLIFFSIFYIHMINIQNYSDRLNDFVKKVTKELTIESVIQDFTILKSDHASSIDKLNNIFSGLTIVGLISSYFVIINFPDSYNSILNYIDLGLYILLQVSYVYVITMVGRSVSDMKSVVNSTSFINRYLSRTSLDTFYYDEEAGNADQLILLRDMNVRTMIKNNENAESIDWIVLNTKLNEQWDSFELLGYQMDDTTLIQNIIGLSGGVFMILGLNKLV